MRSLKLTHSRDISFTSKQIQILETFLWLCTREGVGKITLQKVAKSMNISLGSVHYHFDGKKSPNLLESAIVYVAQESFKYIRYNIEETEKSNEFKGIDSYVKTLFEWAELKTHHYLYWLYFYYLSTFNETYRTVNMKYLKLMRNRIKTLLKHSIDIGLYKEFKISDERIKHLHSLIIGSLLLAGCDPSHKAFLHQQKYAIHGCQNLIQSYIRSS